VPPFTAGAGGTRSGCRERRPDPPNALSQGERDALIAVLDSPRFSDKAPRQVWALLIDEGTYLASVSTMYRLLREAGQVRERRAQAAHPALKKRLPARNPVRIDLACARMHDKDGRLISGGAAAMPKTANKHADSRVSMRTDIALNSA
jgi:hypothetical protein